MVESAGLEPTSVNPLVVAVMAEDGIDLAGKGTQKVFDLYRQECSTLLRTTAEQLAAEAGLALNETTAEEYELRGRLQKV